MARLIKNILDGMRQAFVLWPGSEYVRPKRGGFDADMQLLRGDANLVISGLRKRTLDYGKQIDNR